MLLLPWDNKFDQVRGFISLEPRNKKWPKFMQRVCAMLSHFPFCYCLPQNLKCGHVCLSISSFQAIFMLDVTDMPAAIIEHRYNLSSYLILQHLK